jgi:hypothetical protein
MPSGSAPFAGPPRDSRTLEREVTQLQADVERLLLISEGLWRILRDRFEMSDEDLVREIAKIDLEDGLADYRKKPTKPRQCPKCQRVLSKRRAVCSMCGEPVAMEPFER